jgi:hypothetical protein
MAAEVVTDGGRFSVRTRDLSRGGICFLLFAPLEVGSTFTAELSLVLGNNAFSEPLVLSGKVVWCTAVEEGYQIGATFLTPDKTSGEYLNTFLRLLAEGLDSAVAGLSSGGPPEDAPEADDREEKADTEDRGLFG